MTRRASPSRIVDKWLESARRVGVHVHVWHDENGLPHMQTIDPDQASKSQSNPWDSYTRNVKG